MTIIDNFESLRLELRRGCLIVAVLAQPSCAEHYGYTLRKALKTVGWPSTRERSHPLLRRLETQGLPQSEWREGGKAQQALLPPLGSRRNHPRTAPRGVETHQRLAQLDSSGGMNMELFDRYLKCVGAMLPSGHKADILEELSDDIHSQAEEKEAQLGRPLQLGEQSDILRATGHPVRVAMRYRNIGQHQLISPLLYPAYIFALKVMLLFVCAAHLITALVLLGGGSGAEQVVRRILELPWALIPVFAWITIVFAAFDYLQAKFHLLEIWDSRWNPMDLPVISADRPQPRPLDIVFHMLSGIAFLTYLLVAKHVPYMFFGPAAACLDPGPSWHKIYLPLVFYVTTGVVLQGIALARPHVEMVPVRL